ncbi:MAG TPA: lytic transglycosylase domain-containing protein [Gaiellaceae bacterium]|nr:lytic transglycosylase domain-containing protein [Gaiellaceae bacterium]
MTPLDADLRAAKALLHSQARRERARRRARLRRHAVVTAAATAAALAAAGGPQSATPIAHRPVARHARCPLPARLRPAFALAAKETGLPISLLAAVARVESRFDETARSKAGAVGVLQLMPATADSLHYDALETSANVMAGAVYLRQLLVRYGSTELALAAYNAGPTAVDRLGAQPTAETAAYVERVRQTRAELGNCS